MRSKTYLLFLVFIIFYVSHAFGSYLLDYNTDTVDVEIFKGKASYDLLIHPSNPRVSDGDTYTLEMFISGSGDVDLSRVVVSIPQSIVKKDTIKLYELSYSIDLKTKKPISFYIVKNKSVSSRIGFLVPPLWYEICDVTGNKTDGHIYGERYQLVNGKLTPPYTITFEIAEEAPEGDHNIVIYYSYKTADRWYAEKQIVTVHIKYWYESVCLQILVTVVTILSLLYLLSKPLFWLYRRIDHNHHN